ncbi:MAG: EamA family transporter [Flavobacteriales bacterium]|nr:EamA family transporter [Flavobacteriales bacterium]MCB9448848.1 EamA family transporter [Flavobacteriales bacterium]
MKSDIVRLHLVVVVFAFTGVIGKLISPAVNAPNLVMYRMLFAALGLGAYLIIKGQRLPPVSQWWKFLLVGLLVGCHWVFFFQAIKVSNVSVTLGCFASAALFTSLIEPLLTRSRFSKLDIVMSIMVMVGIYMIFEYAWTYWTGILYALASALLAALFTVINKKFVANSEVLSMSFLELLGGGVMLSAVVLCGETKLVWPGGEDLLYLLVLAWICTSFAFVMSNLVMKTLTAFQVSLTINLEPVYGIVLAVMIFGESERMSAGFYTGACLILATVVLYMPLKRWTKKRGKSKFPSFLG